LARALCNQLRVYGVDDDVSRTERREKKKIERTERGKKISLRL
jgi:hypothetical protein